MYLMIRESQQSYHIFFLLENTVDEKRLDAPTVSCEKLQAVNMFVICVNGFLLLVLVFWTVTSESLTGLLLLDFVEKWSASEKFV